MCQLKLCRLSLLLHLCLLSCPVTSQSCLRRYTHSNREDTRGTVWQHTRETTACTVRIYDLTWKCLQIPVERDAQGNRSTDNPSNNNNHCQIRRGSARTHVRTSLCVHQCVHFSRATCRAWGIWIMEKLCLNSRINEGRGILGLQSWCSAHIHCKKAVLSLLPLTSQWTLTTVIKSGL